MQVSGIDYHEAHLYAPVIHLSIATLFDLDIQQFDVFAAYLHGDTDEEVYVQPPHGYSNRDRA